MNPGTQTRTRTRTNENIQIHLAQEPVLRARRGVEEVEMFEPGGPVGLGPSLMPEIQVAAVTAPHTRAALASVVHPAL